MHHYTQSSKGHAQAAESALPATDSVCGITVDPAKVEQRLGLEGETFSFRSPHRVARFEANPDRYRAVDLSAKEALPHGAASIYACPMYPEIVRHEPGSCPICGMALEPRSVAAEDGADPELRDMSRRFTFAVADQHPAESLLCLRLNALRVPVAAGVLYPFFGLLLSPMIAVVAMSFSSVSVVAKSLRLRRVSL